MGFGNVSHGGNGGYHQLARWPGRPLAGFLPLDERPVTPHFAHHGTPAGRASLSQLAPWLAWERPGTLICALVAGEALHLDMLNVPTTNRVPGLPDRAVVEVPAEIRDGAFTPQILPDFPAPLAALLGRVSRIHDLAAQAATGDRDALREAVDTDPAITNRRAAALTEWLELHADALPQFRPAPSQGVSP